MKSTPIPYKALVLVCVNERTDGRECCAMRDSVFIYEKLKERLRALDPRIRVSRAGCLGHCANGPTVVIQPKNTWLVGVTVSDIDEIIRLATEEEGDELGGIL